MAKLSSGAEIRKIFVSSDPKYRVAGSYGEFTTEVQGDSIVCGNPCFFAISDLCLPNSIYNVTSVNQNAYFRVRTSSGSPHSFQDYSIQIPAGQYTASQIAHQLSTRMSAAASPVSFAWVSSTTTNKFTCTVSNGALGVIFADDLWLSKNDFAGIRITNPKSISSMIGLPYAPDVAMDSYGYTVSISEEYAKPAALIRLHSVRLNCRELSGHTVDGKGSVQTVKKCILSEDFGYLVVDTANAGEMDWYPCPGLTLKQFHWSLVDGPEQNPVELGQPITFSVCFSENPGL